MADKFRSARVYRIGDSKGIKHRKQAMLWLFQEFALTARLLRLSSNMGHFSDIWFLKNQPHTCPSSWLPDKTPGCQEKHWYSLRAPQNRSDAHSFLIGSDASYDSGTVYSLKTILFLRKLCRLTFLLQIEAIHGLIRFCTHSKISLHLSNSWMPYDLEKLSI